MKRPFCWHGGRTSQLEDVPLNAKSLEASITGASSARAAHRGAASIAAGLLLSLMGTPVAADYEEKDVAVLQGLDKITARVSAVEAPVGGTVRFGTLEIVVSACRKRPPEEPPESAAFLEIVDHRPGEEAASLFRGWMFASSPALSALEHAVYDVWVLDCKNGR